MVRAPVCCYQSFAFRRFPRWRCINMAAVSLLTLPVRHVPSSQPLCAPACQTLSFSASPRKPESHTRWTRPRHGGVIGTHKLSRPGSPIPPGDIEPQHSIKKTVPRAEPPRPVSYPRSGPTHPHKISMQGAPIGRVYSRPPLVYFSPPFPGYRAVEVPFAPAWNSAGSCVILTRLSASSGTVPY